MALTHWYPRTSRAAALKQELARLETALLSHMEGAADQLAHISEELRQAQNRADFPTHQIPHWLWLGSQYRLQASENPKVAAKAGACLQFLSHKLRGDSLGEEDRQELNWVLESTVRALAQEIGPADLRGCLDEGELQHIEDRLSGYGDEQPFDPVVARAAVERQVQLLKQFGGVGDLTGLITKIEALFESAQRPGAETAPARAALKYLAEEEDIVCDRSGVLGLVDDIYVVEWAYAAVESQTRCLPLLEAMLRNWPFVASSLLDAEGRTTLDRYAQYVTCAALHTLFGPSAGSLVLRDPGAFPLIAAIASGLELARLQVERFDDEMELWCDGDLVTISDGTDTFRALYGGSTRIGDRTRYRLHVRDSGTITVGEEVLPYIARSSRSYKRLSKGQDISVWLKDRHIDPLTNLTGTGRRRPQFQEAVLLVGPKWKLDEYLDCLRPVGCAPAALLGVRWVDGHQHMVDIGGSSTDRPLVYACSDAATACDLIAEPPSHVVAWKVIVDGARSGRTIHATLRTADRLDNVSLCVFAELSEREATSELARQGLKSLWYLEDQDVSVPRTHHAAPRPGANPLTRFVDRQSNHWATIQSFHLIGDPFLEQLALLIQERTESADDATGMQALDYAAADFLRQATCQPLRAKGPSDELLRVATNISAQASTLSAYNAAAAGFRDLFRRFVESGGEVSDRTAGLVEVAASAPSGTSIAVVCRSLSIADKCRAASSSIPGLSGLDWMNIEFLRRKAPYDRVLVPGWLDRHAMRELASNGYGARTELVLFPFEKSWFDNVLSAARRWEKRLENDTISTLREVATDLGGRSDALRWQEQTRKRLEPVGVSQGPEPDDRSDADLLEERSIEALARSIPKGSGGQATAKAQLILFEEAGAYALLPPHGRTIVLQAPGQDALSPNKTDAERQLFRNVADLEPGMLLALPEATDRDLIDARADHFLADPSKTRELAGLWKIALKRHFDARLDDPQSFSRKMAEAGEARDPATIRSWVTDTKSVAPRNYRHVVPLLASLTGESGLIDRLSDVLTAIDLLYRARGRAAEALLHDVFSGEIDLNAPRLSVELSDRELSFGLHRVRLCAGIRDVAVDCIGRLSHFSDMMPEEVD